MFDLYDSALWAILVLLLTVLIQGMIAAISKASQPGAIPGKMDAQLSHESFVFRAHRTFANSLENLPVMLGSAFLAVIVGADVFWTVLFTWVMAVARIIHMLLYYKIATEQNPSPRSYFFLIALMANMALLVISASALL